jgi:hypothetical protein
MVDLLSGDELPDPEPRRKDREEKLHDKIG